MRADTVQVIPGVTSKGIKRAPNPHKPELPKENANTVNSARLLTTYPVDTGATSVWGGQDGHAQTGAGTTVAVIDSGIDATIPDFARHITAINVNQQAQNGGADGFGPGSHVAGITG